jgi:hypothetical protein
MKLSRRYMAVLLMAASLTAARAGAGQSSSAAAVSIPQQISFKGAVTAPDGKPATGVLPVTFLIYEEDEGGSPLWIETQDVTLDATGHYTVMLGARTRGGLPAELFASKAARWLGVEPQGLPVQPRVPLVSVPYAFKAGDAETIGGLPPSAFLRADALPRGSIAEAQSSSAISATSPAGSGTANYIPRWTPNGTTLGNSALFQSGTGSAAKIGINTNAPAATLDVAGGVIARGALQLPSKGAASASKGLTSQPLTLQASVFSSSKHAAIAPKFEWQAEPAGNNTASPGATMNLLYGAAGTAVETGLSIAGNGRITFSPGQTFPGTGKGTITGVAAGPGLNGGGASGNITLGLDTTKVPQLNAANNFTGDQTVAGNLTSSASVSGSTLNATSSFNLAGNPFAFGSKSNANSYLGFAGNQSGTGGNNVGTGPSALLMNGTGSGNTANGASALMVNSTGSNNSAFGLSTLSANVTGGSNTAIGNNALAANTTGSGNTAVGANAGPDSSHKNLTNATAIGANATVTASNALVLGSINGVNGATADTSVGIGTSAPAATLDVHGTANFTGPVTFASTQTFPGTGKGTITGVAAGTDLVGGGASGAVTLSLDTTKVPQLNAANTFTGDQTLNGNLSSSASVSGSTVNAATGFNLDGNAFAFGSHSTSNSFLAFAGNATAAGNNNLGIGQTALLNHATGSGNTGAGVATLKLNSSGSNNSALGYLALTNNTTGASNTAVGNNALSENATGSNNTALGVNAGPDPAHQALSNSTAIGANAMVTASNSMVLGSINGMNGATADTLVGIGTTAPAAKLDVHGNANFTGPVTFASGQTFPGTITGVTAGTGLTGGGNSGAVTVNLDTTYSDGRYAQLGANNTFTGRQVINNAVGIGIVPSYPLHVSGTIRSESGFSLGGNAPLQVDAPGIIAGHFVVTPTGRVGIDNPNPATTLDVGGNINASGYIDAGGTLIGQSLNVSGGGLINGGLTTSAGITAGAGVSVGAGLTVGGSVQIAGDTPMSAAPHMSLTGYVPAPLNAGVVVRPIFTIPSKDILITRMTSNGWNPCTNSGAETFTIYTGGQSGVVLTSHYTQTLTGSFPTINDSGALSITVTAGTPLWVISNATPSCPLGSNSPGDIAITLEYVMK